MNKNQKRTFITVVLATFISISLIAQQTRTEKDLLGEKQIPADAYYGVQTLRALENFQISGVKTNFYPDYVRAYAMVKTGCCPCQHEVGRMKRKEWTPLKKPARP